MRFLCDSCRAQYMISDDKVPPRGVKVRCKKCGYVILVRRGEPISSPAAESQAEPSSDTQAHHAAQAAPPSAAPASGGGAPGILQGLADDEIGAVFDQALSGAEGDGGAGGEAALGSAEQEPPASGAPLDGPSMPAAAEATNSDSAHEWFVAIDEKQVGPLSVENVKELWNRGELGPDSLCWRAGMTDWVALSEAPEVASLLAPKPKKPVIVAPASLAATELSLPTPVESAFSAGLTPRGVRLEAGAVPTPPSAAEQSGSWKPAAAAALASLMKEEIEVLAHPSLRSAPAGAEAATEGVLSDVDAPLSNGHAGAFPSTKQNGAAAASPAPIAISDPYPSVYPAATLRGPRRGWIIGLSIAGGALLLALAVVTTILVVSSRSTEPVVARAPAPANPAPPPQERAKPSAPNPPSTAPAGAQAAPSPQPPPAPLDTAPAPAIAEPSGVSRYDKATRRERRRRSASEEITAPRKAEKAEVASAPPPAPAHNSSEDDFDRVFGGVEKRKSAIPKAEPRKPASVYVPPAPGSSEIPEALGTADIMRVVVDNKPSIKQCVDEQRKRDPSLSGKIVMSWTILPSGRTASVSCSADEFKSSYMAQCLTGLIKSWQFPRHKVQGETINFPFTF